MLRLAADRRGRPRILIAAGRIPADRDGRLRMAGPRSSKPFACYAMNAQNRLPVGSTAVRKRTGGRATHPIEFSRTEI